MSAFTLWTEKALICVDVSDAPSGYFYGVAYWAEVWFRFYHSKKFACGSLYLHRSNKPDIECTIGRRNS